MNRIKGFLFIIMVFLFIPVSSVMAATINDVSAKISNDKQVTISGIVSSGSGQILHVKIIDPEGNIEYAGNTESTTSGNFTLSYTMTNTEFGFYQVFINSLGMSTPIETSFSYGINNDLDSLTDSVSSLTAAASIDSSKKVTISGITSSGPGQIISVKIIDPKGNVEYVNAITSTSGGIYQVSYTLVNANTGQYMVETSAAGMTNPIVTYFDYITEVQLPALSLEAEISSEKLVTIIGTIDKKAVQPISVRITDPDGVAEYINNINCSADGSFQFTYPMLNTKKGVYNVTASTLGLNSPLTAQFTYGPSADLTGLAVVTADLSPAFSSEQTDYSSLVKYTVRSVKVIPTAKDKEAEITVNGTPVQSGKKSSPIHLDEGLNSIRVVVTSMDVSKTYTLNITRKAKSREAKPLSSNANLIGLIISNGTLSPAFDSGTTDYTANVANTVSSISLTPTIANSRATVKINNVTVKSGSVSGNIDLAVGENIIPVTVTAQNGKVKTYTVTVTRAVPVVAALSGLVLSNNAFLEPGFDPAIRNYTVDVDSSVSSITVTPTAESGSSILVNNNTVISGTASDSISLSPGNDTIISVEVTAWDGITSCIYTITVTRAAPVVVAPVVAALSGLVLSNNAFLEPDFEPAIRNYTVDVDSSVSSITVTPTAVTGSSILVNNHTVLSGTASDSISLSPDNDTIISVEVTAWDGITCCIYTITVNRAAPAPVVAALSGLVLSNNAFLEPDFDSAIRNYTVDVDSSVSSITVTPTAVSGSSILVNNHTVLSGTASESISLSPDNDTIISVEVTAWDGITSCIYTITVTRAAPVTTLSSLEITNTQMGSHIIYDPDTIFDYQFVTVDDYLEFIPIASDPNSVITVVYNGVTETIDNGDSYNIYNIDLVDSPLELTIKVTAQDGVTFTEYTINIEVIII